MCSPTTEVGDVFEDVLTTVDVCVGTSVNPCLCNESSCMVSLQLMVAVIIALIISVMGKDTLEMVCCVPETAIVTLFLISA